MNRLQTFRDFLATQSIQIAPFSFAVNLILAGLLAYILRLLYIKYGQSLSNRKKFGDNFILITMTTMVIITIVKSSLALSLGLVGALSIVRFRAAIKEPEELSYLFLSISMGLGFGADQRLITLLGFFIIAAVIWLRHFSRTTEEEHNLLLTVTKHGKDKPELNKITDILKSHCAAVKIKRFDESEDSLETAFIVEIEDINKLEQSKLALQKLDSSMQIAFLDNKGII